MPIYEFRCDSGHRFEDILPMGTTTATCRCGSLAKRRAAPSRISVNIKSGRTLADLGSGKHTVAWISPDGTRAAVLDGEGRGPQADLYRRSGYERVECKTLADLERVNRIRTVQKSVEAGHEVTSRFEVSDYDSSTMRAENENLKSIEAGESEGNFIQPTIGVPDIIPSS